MCFENVSVSFRLQRYKKKVYAAHFGIIINGFLLGVYVRAV